MLAKYFDQIESIGLYLFFAFIFVFIGLSIRGVMKENDVPKMGQYVVYFVLLLGCVGFIVKGVVQLILETEGIG